MFCEAVSVVKKQRSKIKLVLKKIQFFFQLIHSAYVSGDSKQKKEVHNFFKDLKKKSNSKNLQVTYKTLECTEIFCIP